MLIKQDRESMIAAIRAEGLDIDLDGAEVRSGWENVVLDTVDGWILRFPRDEQVPFRRELALLDRLHDHLPAPIPRVLRVGTKTRFAGYRRIDGVSLDVAAFATADPMIRDRVAAGLARFLAVMHTATELPQIRTLTVPAFDADGLFPLDAERLTPELWPRFNEVRDDLVWRLEASPHRPVLLHNDFHVGNLVLDEPLGKLTGVWDFSCVAIGNPSLEFRYLAEDSELAARIASAYAARTGREIDLGLAVAALRLEQVSDALVENRDPAPYLA